MMESISVLYQKYQKSITLSVIAMILFLILTPLVIVPQISLLLTTRKDIEEGKDRLIRLERKKSQIEEAKIEVLRRDLSLASLALPPNKDIGSILFTLDVLSQRFGVVLGNFSASVGSLDDVSEPQKTGREGGRVGAPFLSMTISARGDTERIRNFLQGLSQSLPLNSIEKISLTKSDVLISFLFYYKPVPTTLPPVDSELPPLSKFQDTIASLSSMRSQTIAPSLEPLRGVDEPVSLPAPQKFKRVNPFF